MRNFSLEWLWRNHGKIFHPLEIFSVLTRDYDYPSQKYFVLEEKGHIIPRSYKNGEITSARLFFPPYPLLKEIEAEYSLQRGILKKKLNDLFVNISMRRGTLRLSENVIKRLEENCYLITRNGHVRLGKRGHYFLQCRN